MSMINWAPALSVNVNIIDMQHKKLFDMINSFYENISKGSSKEKLLEIINAMKDYTVVHFSTEEKYMKLHNYPGYDDHKSEHDKFVEKVISFEERYKNGKLLLSLEVTTFLKEWILDHIMKTDKKCGAYLAQHGIK